MRLVVNPGQDLKCPFFDSSDEGGRGWIESTPDVYYSRPLLVWSSQIIPFAICLGLWEMLGGGMEDCMGMDHRPVMFLYPVIMT